MEKRCSSNHLLTLRTKRSSYFRCRYCDKFFYFEGKEAKVYGCGCYDWYICCPCFKEISVIQFNWVELCNDCKPEWSDNTLSQCDAITIVCGYFLQNSINYWCDDIINLCLKYFWYYYRLKEFYDKFHSQLISPKLYHLRPLIKSNAIGMIKYVLNRTKSNYVNSTYKTNGKYPHGSIVWEIIKQSRSSESMYNERNINLLQFCADYNIDLNKHFENIFLKFPQGFSAYDTTQRDAFTILERLVKINEKNEQKLDINHVDKAIRLKWFKIAGLLINNGCQITNNCYNIYLRYLMSQYNLISSDLYNHKDTCFDKLFTMEECEALSVARLLYDKYNRNVNINYVERAICNRWCDLLKWLIDHNAMIEDKIWLTLLNDDYNYDALIMMNYIYEKTQNIDFIINYIDIPIKKGKWRQATWMLEHGAIINDNCFDNIFKTEKKPHYNWRDWDLQFCFTQKIYEINKNVLKHDLEYYRSITHQRNWSVINDWLYSLIIPDTRKCILKYLNLYNLSKDVCILIISYLPNPNNK